jgi:hypothetical protein
MDFQPFLGALFDQQVDKRPPAGLVDRFSQQGPIAVIVKSLVLLTHLTPPRTFSGQRVYQPAVLRKSPLRTCLPCSASRRDRRRPGDLGRGLFGLLGLRPGGFLGARGHPCIVFGRAAPRRYSGRDATHPLRHVRQPFARGFPGAGRQQQTCKAQKCAGEHWRESIHPQGMPRQCGGLDPQSRLRWDDSGSGQGSVNHTTALELLADPNELSGLEFELAANARGLPAIIFVNRLRLPFEQSRKS